jgi:hypothetical protein
VVEGARLESEYGPKAHPGFESLPLRHGPVSRFAHKRECVSIGHVYRSHLRNCEIEYVDDIFHRLNLGEAEGASKSLRAVGKGMREKSVRRKLA